MKIMLEDKHVTIDLADLRHVFDEDPTVCRCDLFYLINAYTLLLDKALYDSWKWNGDYC